MVTEDFRGAESKLFQKDWLGCRIKIISKRLVRITCYIQN